MTRQNLRIVQVIPSFVVGGAETVAIQLAEAQQEAGHEVSLLAVTSSGPLAERLPPALAARTHILGKRGLGDVGTLARAHRVLRQLQPDVVHTHLFTAAAWATPAARALRVPVVLHTEHAAEEEPSRVVRAAQRALSALQHGIVACSPAAAIHLAARRLAPWTSVEVIENGIPLRARAVAMLGHAPARLIAVGRLVPVKGHRFLIDAVRILHDAGRPVALDVLGDGELRDDLEGRIRRLGLAGFVTLHGNVPDVAHRLAEADLFVLPSISEAFPLVTLEAAAAGLPLVVTEGGGATLIDEGVKGEVVPPRDPAALAGAIVRQLDLDLDAQRAAGRANRAIVVTRHDIGRTVAAYEVAYRRLAALRSSAA